MLLLNFEHPHFFYGTNFFTTNIFSGKLMKLERFIVTIADMDRKIKQSTIMHPYVEATFAALYPIVCGIRQFRTGNTCRLSDRSGLVQNGRVKVF